MEPSIADIKGLREAFHAGLNSRTAYPRHLSLYIRARRASRTKVFERDR
jgi:hypothetical protein